MFHWFWCLLLILLVACQPAYDYELYQAEPEHLGYIGVYVEEDPSLPPEVVLEGCQMWYPEGADCELVPNPGMARVEVYVNRTSECVTDTGKLVGWATLGKVTLFAECLHKVHGREVPDDELAIIVAHEIGHLFGIGHVPLDCEHPERSLNDGDGLTYSEFGDMVCGPALMNAEPFMDFVDDIGMTTVDHEAFLVRDREYALF